ncbi:TlpA disulfide reductase family protein [Nonlabens ulvanivorans]|uniref:Thiol, disulfide interchange protein n=1 Tax=Nonlabens ulvanivorans TaxID=906888 RepID=A0A084JWJ7_NONUL|nr:TlpA disulfide reductase family protein [Nonlabens ulvanivorans]KEZ93331.1 thiol, disulfide interchange protein [Nonlabens ulvanivorans]PRX13544.1 thiol-disulfide isomerase/thioredoxin [Nonlabens ulvanivorans]GAL75764.1 thiol:disulfide interchange protein [Nonlabens ulvanivorans]
MRFLLPIVALLLIISCKTETSNDNTHFIEGTAPGVYNGMRVYMNKLNSTNNPMIIDTAVVMNEKFYFEQGEKKDFAEVRFLSMETGNDRMIFIEGDEPLRITLNQDSLWASSVTGSEENRILYDFRADQATYQKRTNEFKTARGNAYRSGDQQKGDDVTKTWMDAEEAYKNEVFNIVKSNPNKLVSSMIIGDLVNSKLIDTDKALELFNVLEGDVKETAITKSLESYLTKFTTTAIGAKAPLFEGKTPDGDVLKLENVLGKVTLIDFWASWCGPCRRENPNVVRAYKEYHDKGFNIISVSLDRQNAEAAWKAAIEKDEMDWYHISRLMHWQDPIAKLYNVSSIPATFLLDENGVIIAKDLRGQALHNKLAELL